MFKIIKREFRELGSPFYGNFMYISLSSLTTARVGFIFWAVVARLYPVTDVGVASAVISALNMTFQLAMPGMNFALIRFYPEYRGRATESALFVVSIAGLIFSIIYSLLMVTLRSFLRSLRSFSSLSSCMLLIVFAGFSIVEATYNVLSTYAIAKRKVKHGFIQSLLFSLMFAFLFVCASLGVVRIISSFGVGLMVGVIYALIFIWDGVIPRIDHKFLEGGPPVFPWELFSRDSQYFTKLSDANAGFRYAW